MSASWKRRTDVRREAVILFLLNAGGRGRANWVSIILSFAIANEDG